jgi:hypothetical protein
LKILYACSNNLNAKIQLNRFLPFIKDHQIKIAAYKKSSPLNINIDWTLDCLLNVFQPNVLSLENDNLHIYYDQIKDYNPDLIISDLEYFTSYLAGLLNIPIWQCSSSLINYGISFQERYELGLQKFYGFILNQNKDLTINLITNADRNFVYSHWGDVEYTPILNNKFEWVRPYYETHKESQACHHQITAIMYGNNKNIFNQLKKYSTDSVVFTESCVESYPHVQIKDIDNFKEYGCNLRNSDLFACQGQTSFLADAFYNQKFSLLFPDFLDPESIINSHLSSRTKQGHIVRKSEKIKDLAIYKIENNLNDVKYLHQKLEEL